MNDENSRWRASLIKEWELKQSVREELGGVRRV